MGSGGLRARLPVLATDLTPEFESCHLVEGLLEPDPIWLSGSYFGDLPLEMVRDVVGDYLLRVEVPSDFPGLYVVDHAHGFECKHVTRRGRPASGPRIRLSNGARSSAGNCPLPGPRFGLPRRARRSRNTGDQKGPGDRNSVEVYLGV